MEIMSMLRSWVIFGLNRLIYLANMICIYDLMIGMILFVVLFRVVLKISKQHTKSVFSNLIFFLPEYGDDGNWKLCERKMNFRSIRAFYYFSLYDTTVHFFFQLCLYVIFSFSIPYYFFRTNFMIGCSFFLILCLWYFIYLIWQMMRMFFLRMNYRSSLFKIGCLYLFYVFLNHFIFRTQTNTHFFVLSVMNQIILPEFPNIVEKKYEDLIYQVLTFVILGINFFIFFLPFVDSVNQNMKYAKLSLKGYLNTLIFETLNPLSFSGGSDDNNDMFMSLSDRKEKKKGSSSSSTSKKEEEKEDSTTTKDSVTTKISKSLTKKRIFGIICHTIGLLFVISQICDRVSSRRRSSSGFSSHYSSFRSSSSNNNNFLEYYELLFLICVIFSYLTLFYFLRTYVQTLLLNHDAVKNYHAIVVDEEDSSSHEDSSEEETEGEGEDEEDEEKKKKERRRERKNDKVLNVLRYLLINSFRVLYAPIMILFVAIMLFLVERKEHNPILNILRTELLNDTLVKSYASLTLYSVATVCFFRIG